MTDYSNQNITGLNLTGANLTGANFTNTNATNVNFTNAIITNATFKNTLITGATLTGITFSNLQKGQLLLRAANLTITAVNNLTSLTIQELRTIQPAISLRSLNMIQTVSVAVPNNTGQGYNVAVTPSLTQAVCVFVATNQNIIITTAGATIRTIRNNGTVIQDVDDSNATLSHIIIGSIPYRISVGNGDGVIGLIPIDLNQYRVNDSGFRDIISLNTNVTNNLYWSGSANKVSFVLPSIVNLKTHMVKGFFRFRLKTGGTGQLNYPLFIFNNHHSYPSTNNSSTEYSFFTTKRTNTTYPANGGSHQITPYVVGYAIYYDEYIQNSQTIANMAVIPGNNATDAYLNIHFEITLNYDVSLDRSRSIMAHGQCHLVVREPGGSVGVIEKWEYVREHGVGGSSLTHLGVAAFTNWDGGVIYGANLFYEVVPLGRTNNNTGAGSL